MATTTPNYGWPVPTSSDYVKDGATAIEALGDAIDATVFGLGSAGLTLISTTTIGTAVASTAVTNCFSSTYDNYKIIVSGGTASGADRIAMQLGSSTTSNYGSFIRNARNGTGAVSVLSTNNAARMSYVGGTDTNGINAEINLISPFLSKFTWVTAFPKYADEYGTMNGVHLATTSFTGFSLEYAAGTATGGTIKVYGYKN